MMASKRVPLLEDEEPPISFYADLVEQGTVEVEYNETGNLIVTQGTQYDEAMIKEERGPGSMILKLVLVVCGILTTYTIYRIALVPISCSCTNESCASSGMQVLGVLKRQLGLP
ncbi:hypothetical protein KR038_007349 [Drosophila bunnanda]|nr:hypothetical protein KR038_007349 [Drosophila bunnanda]